MSTNQGDVSPPPSPPAATSQIGRTSDNQRYKGKKPVFYGEGIRSTRLDEKFGGWESGSQTVERPKQNLKSRSQPIDQLNALFGGARQRELSTSQVPEERGIDDSNHEPGQYLDSYRRNWRNENRWNWRETERQQQQQERQPSPETWRKPVKQPNPVSPEVAGVRSGKAASALEIALNFSKSLSSALEVAHAFSKLFSDDSSSGAAEASLKILSYNVWFREDLELQRRMKAIGDLIQLHSPDLICFQEVTRNIYDIFRRSNWWKLYRCSISDEMAGSRRYFCMQLSKLPVKSFSRIPFENSIMGRELCMTEVEVLGGKTMIVATSHLESPCPAPPKWDQMFSEERVEQAEEAINILQNNSNVIFGGDMNWDNERDGQFPLPDGWIDAWRELRPAENGWTYDTKSNPMLSGNYPLRRRLDRFVCNLHDFKVS
ncbi:hypothetical protein DITRI_Ditri19aG0013900 [Diplodiscus trichospermus]